MRRGSHGKTIHRLDDGTLVGINLGADFCAEHEWGIENIRRAYSMNDAAEGVARRQIGRFPAEHVMFDSIKPKRSRTVWHGLLSLRHATDRKYCSFDDDMLSRTGLSPLGDDELHGAWDEGSFGFLVKDEVIAREIHDALANLDICIGLFNGDSRNPFSRSGLGLLIASRIPQSVRDRWLESDRDRRSLEEASTNTGIALRLQVAGLQYFALSPKWLSGFRGDKRKTKHPVIYWLNPYQQDENNFGWFTVEDLDAWIAGTGPIPKRAKATA